MMSVSLKIEENLGEIVELDFFLLKEFELHLYVCVEVRCAKHNEHTVSVSKKVDPEF